ncbi:MAG: HD-GYP domain-containing protein [Clostridia bacterium]|nr:HD-GYP domain-containing protein [Clostridia bacterium]
MGELPRQARIYIAAITIAGVALLTYLAREVWLGGFDWKELLLFFILLVVADSLPVELPQGGVVTVGFSLYVAALILWGAAPATLLVVASDALSIKNFGIKIPWYKYLFNLGQLSLAAGLGGLAFESLGGQASVLSPFPWMPLIGAVLVSLVINTGAVIVIISLTSGDRIHRILSANIRWAVPNYIGLAPLGVLLATVYISMGAAGVLLLSIPLLLARHAFQLYRDMRQNYLDTIETLSAAMDAKDPYTYGHSERVARYAVALAQEINLPDQELEQLRYVALLHDIGKIAVRDGVLNKAGRLDKKEMNEVQLHTTVGAEITKKLRFFKDAYRIVLYHHEHWNGGGYPHGLSGEAIPLGSRIIAVCDAFDAMTSNRPYRAAMSPLAALEELKASAGTQLDPTLVQAFIRAYDRLGFDHQVAGKISSSTGGISAPAPSHAT